MRYTTIIDITEVDEIYRNRNARLVYLHLCLRSGYRTDDRDRIRISIRKLSWEVGISTAAARYALQQLEKAQLLTYSEGGTIEVVKFITPEPYAKRPANKSTTQAAPDPDHGEEIRQIKDEMLKLQRWYNDFKERGDETQCKTIQRDYQKLAAKLKKLT